MMMLYLSKKKMMRVYHKKQKILKKKKQKKREITVRFEPLGPYERLVLWFSCHFGRNKCLTQ